MPPKKKMGENPESDSDSDSDGADVHQTTRNMVREQENELLKYKTAKVVKEKGEYPEINSLPGRKLDHGALPGSRVKVFYDDMWMTVDKYKKQRENHSRPSLSMMHALYAGLPKTTSGKKDAQTLVSNLGTRPARASKPFSVQVHVPVTRDILPATREAAVSAGETKTAATAFVRRSSNPPSDNSFVKTPFAGSRPGYTFQTNGKWGDGYYKIISPVPVQSTSLEYPDSTKLHNYSSGYSDMGGRFIPYVIYKGNPMPLSEYKVLYKKHNPPPKIFKNINNGLVGKMIGSPKSSMVKVQVINKDIVSFLQQTPFHSYITFWPTQDMRLQISTLRKEGGRKYKKKRKSKTHCRRKRKRKRTKKFRKGSKSKTHKGKNFETRKTSKNYSSKRWKRMTGRRTRKAPLFPFI